MNKHDWADNFKRLSKAIRTSREMMRTEKLIFTDIDLARAAICVMLHRRDVDRSLTELDGSKTIFGPDWGVNISLSKTGETK
jgi:hypothetical protein